MAKTDTERINELETKLKDKTARMIKIMEEYNKLESETKAIKNELQTLKQEKTQKEVDNDNALKLAEKAEQDLEAQILLMEQKLKIK